MGLELEATSRTVQHRVCSRCNRVFRTTRGLSRHTRTVHYIKDLELQVLSNPNAVPLPVMQGMTSIELATNLLASVKFHGILTTNITAVSIAFDKDDKAIGIKVY